MIKIENVEVMGWEHAIRGMRNPKNSWERSDSRYNGVRYLTYADNEPECFYTEEGEPYVNDAVVLGPNDHKLMIQLAKGGAVHAKYRRMITVYLDITAPLYWWKEFDTYKVGTVVNSCSTMHKIHDKEFTLDDFSCEHLFYGDSELEDYLNENAGSSVYMAAANPMHVMNILVGTLNYYRMKFVEIDRMLHTKELSQEKIIELCKLKKKYWWQMIQLLPSSYNQKRTIMLNYEVLVGMYEWRKDHKLDEWKEFCKWIESLPCSELITGEV